ncbi:hypothetical protein V4C53_06390 [Paraburkholderia azotifigens]
MSVAVEPCDDSARAAFMDRLHSTFSLPFAPVAADEKRQTRIRAGMRTETAIYKAGKIGSSGTLTTRQ